KMGGQNVALGTDFNGFPGYPSPRFGGEACHGGKGHVQTARVTYPLSVSVSKSPSTLGQSKVGDKTFDYNVDGFAHIGLLPDFIEDLRRQGLRNADLDPLMNSAEAYIRMWERAEATNVP
ncbi:MAG TPA: peptidase, partial [Myxococcaceae bacterium]|nr:peptidase [Myxococcaceae bacterium]